GGLRGGVRLWLREGVMCVKVSSSAQVCVNFECRGADVLSYDCDVHTKCHGHGVCNSNRNCHCDYGWAPPFCELSGYGGSVDSGPTWNGMDGLLVLFFVVLPLLALGVFVFLRRNELLRRLGLSLHAHTHAATTAGTACSLCCVQGHSEYNCKPLAARVALLSRSCLPQG
uniref:EGF-like domain-containing protein n=1 Tax=Neolamprologus brichardi TaxID=32507 RepID=A0A3Q4GLY1_NEOBR